MFQTLKNAWNVIDLRRKILFVALIIGIFRLGSAIPVPYLDASVISAFLAANTDSMFGYLNMFSGGAFAQATLFAMSITPYINAQIIMQLLTVGIPALERIAKEGETGQKKIAQWTRYLTVALGLIQAFGYYMFLNSYGAVRATGGAKIFAAFVIILTFTAGTALIMWLGEQINDKGIGNGISMILFASIISRGPSMVSTLVTYMQNGTLNWITLPLIVLLFLFMVLFVVFMTNAERRIPVQYAKRVVGRKQYGGQSTNLPIKVNMSGVLPIIFASTLVSLPGTIAAFFKAPAEGTFWHGFLGLFKYDSWFYAILYFVLIIVFAYFYVAISFNPVEVSNNMRKNGGFIPGIRPGKPTSDFITKILNKITLVGALFLSVVAVLPIILSIFLKVNISLGGTSLLIVVGVALETVKELETQMMMRHYKGFLE